MKTDFNLTHLNSSVIDMYIEPNLDWHVNKENFNMSFLNFTFNATEFNNNTLVFNLNFNEPLAISPNLHSDVLVWHIKDLNDFFISETLL